MAIYGKIDAAAFTQSIGVTNGDATVSKNAADSVVPGDVLEISSVAYIVKQVTSTTAIELHKNYAGSTATVAAANVIKRTPPKAVAEYVIKGGDSISNYQLVFVDTTEDGIASNKTRGIDGPGWWLYRTYQTHNGTERHKAEKLASLRVAAGTSGDTADETVVADVLETITVGTQPANSTSSSGAGTFVAAATVDQSGTITYKWQRQTATATTRWVDVSASLDTGITYANFTTATLAYSGLAGTTLNGYKYRCVINSSKGAVQKYTDGAATLTFGS